MLYSILYNDSDVHLWLCDRCGREIRVAVRFNLDGREMSVGRECAKHFGIVWTPKRGPLADDEAMFERAVEIFRMRRRLNRWPGGWESCRAVKEALGSLAWRRAAVYALNA